MEDDEEAKISRKRGDDSISRSFAKSATINVEEKMAIKLEMSFDKREDFIKKVVYDKSFGKKGVIVLKMKYQSREVAENVESISIAALRSQLTNSDSGKTSFEGVHNMFPEMGDEIADLILEEFLEAHSELKRIFISHFLAF